MKINRKVSQEKTQSSQDFFVPFAKNLVVFAVKKIRII